MLFTYHKQTHISGAKKLCAALCALIDILTVGYKTFICIFLWTKLIKCAKSVVALIEPMHKKKLMLLTYLNEIVCQLIKNI